MAISGDYILVGAPGKDSPGNVLGAAYVFYRNQGGTDNWGAVAQQTVSESEHHFIGWEVAINGDHAILGSSQGAAYMFYRNQGGIDNWGIENKLIVPDTEDAPNFGRSVSISGNDVIVGASVESPIDNGSLSHRGAAYLYSQ